MNPRPVTGMAAAGGRGERPLPTITAGLRRAADRAPHAAALFLPDGPGGRGAAGWRALTNRQLWAASRGVVRAVRRAGLRTGDRAVVLVPPSAAFFALAFGLLDAGVVPVLVDPGIGRRHLGRCLAEADAVAFFGTPKAQAARIALRLAPSARRHVVVGSRAHAAMGRATGGRSPLGIDLERLAQPDGTQDAGAATPVGPEDAAAIVFTSGSTGPPKGVTYRHGNFAGQMAALAALYDLGPADVHVATFPPFALFGPALGMTTVIPRMDPTRPAAVHPPDIAEAVTAFDATVLFGSPALLDTVGRWALRERRRDGVAATNPFAGLRLVMSAGAPVARRIVDTVAGLLDDGARLVTPYGATEALPVTSVDHRELEAAAGDGVPPALRGVCVGRPAPGVDVTLVRVTDEPLARLDPRDRMGAGQLGEIVATGPVVTTEYFRRPEATRAAKIEWDGRLAHRMGDLGVLDGDGRLWFAGRKAHLVHARGGPIPTVPVERAFDAHPWVARSALLGLGPPGVQRPCLCVELAADAPPSEVAVPVLRALADAHPHTAVVRAIRVHPGFPVDIRHNAKIDYGELERWWRATAEGGGG
jgi:olefin beta-lactone synthetase